MSFSDDAIGFFLRLDDQLTPQLATAGQAYSKFVKSLDTYNQQAQRSANKGFGALASLVESFERLPKTAEKAYAKAVGLLKKKIKPLTQTVGLEFGAKAEKSLSRAIRQAVSDVFGKLKIRLTATAPLKRSKFFDTSIPMRAFYKTQPQPPDLMGGFQNLPRFAEGGEVMGGGRKGIDDILALLREGEIVLPKDVAGILKEITKRKALPKGLAASIMSVGKLGKELEDLQDAVELGLDAKAPGLFRKGVIEIQKEFQQLIKTTAGMSKGRKALIPMLKVAKIRMEQFTSAGKDAQPVYKTLLTKILGPARFLAISEALGRLQEGFRNVTGAARDAATQIGADADVTVTFFENVREANKTLGISRKEFTRWTQRIVENSSAQFGGMVSSRGLGEAFLALTQAGVRNRKQLEELTPVVDMLAAATGEDPGGLAHTFYRLSDAYGFTRDQSVAYMLTLRNVAAATALDLGTLQEQMKENLEGGLGAFLQTVKSPEVRKAILENFAKVTGALVNQWGDTGGAMAKQISDALTDPQAAAQLSRFLGMQQGELMATLQREGGAEEIVRSLSRTIRTTLGAGGDVSRSLTLFKEAFSFEGNVAELQRLILSGEEFEKQAAALTDTTVKTADAMAGLKDATNNALSGWTQFKNSVGTWITGNVPASLLDFLDDFSLTAAAASVFLGVQLVSAITALTKAQWLWNIAMSANPVVLIIAGVIALGAAIFLIVKNWDVVTRAFQGGIFLITDLFDTLKGWVMSVWDVVTKAFQGGIFLITDLFSAVWDVVTRAFQGGIILITDLFKTVKGWAMSAIDWVAGFGEKLLFLLVPIGSIISAVKDFGAIWDWLKEKVMGVWDFIVGNISVGIEGVKGIFGSILGFVMAPLEAIKGFINRWIIEPINTLASYPIPVVGPLKDLSEAISRVFPLPSLTHGGIATEPTLATVGDVPEAIIPLDRLSEFTQEIAQAFPTRAAIEEAILVKLDPNTTDQPVRDAVEAQTVVLRQLLDAVVTGKPIVVPVSARAGGSGHTPRAGVSPMTAGVAEGMF